MPWNNGSTTALTGRTEKALYTSILVIISAFSAATNLCVIRIIWVNKRLHRLCYYVFINLCVTHMQLVFFNIPFIIQRVYSDSVNVNLCQLQAFALSSCMVASICGIAIICCIRWLAITKPYHYRNLLGKKWLIIPIVAFVWLHATISSFPPMVGWGKYMFYRTRHLCLHDFSPIDVNRISYLVFFGLSAFFCPISLTLYFQFSSLNVARQQCKKDKNMLSSRRSKRNPLRALSAGLCVLGVYILLWLPHGILVALWDIQSHRAQPPADLETISMVVAMCSSFTTPMCFTLTDRLLRSRVIHFFRSVALMRMSLSQ